MGDPILLVLLVWGTMVGVDLIAGPQVMIARPLVAAIVAGFLVGDVVTGVSVGLVLELFAWDIMPFGAARYPDYGIGAVAAVWTSAHAPGVLGLGLAIGVGLFVAYLGELAVQTVRYMNSADLERHANDLDNGEYAAARNLHLRGIFREVARSGVLASVGLGLAELTNRFVALDLQGAIGATVMATGLAIGVGFNSGVRVAGSTRPKQLWYVVGMAIGIGWVVLR